ncbi:MAG: hypothetical protein ACLPTF_23975 [Steroidobacteraceae bacterium]
MRLQIEIDTGKDFYVVLPQRDAESDDSPMITAVYEAHLSMEKMLAALAELRMDDAEGALEQTDGARCRSESLPLAQ